MSATSASTPPTTILPDLDEAPAEGHTPPTSRTVPTDEDVGAVGDPCLTAALRYAERGLAVLPLHTVIDGYCTCQRPACPSPGKHPRTPHGVKDASKDAGTIRGWWTRWPDSNIGIATGATSGVIVLDVDGPEGAETLRKFAPRELRFLWWASTGRGAHVYFRHPGGETRTGRLGPGLDLRGDGAYVVAPPSVHVSGANYTWKRGPGEEKEGAGDTPPWLLQRVEDVPGNGHQTCTDLGGTRDWLKMLQGVPEGERRVALQIAGHYLGIGWKPEEVEALLLGFAAQCTPPHDPEDIRRIVRDLAAKEAEKGNLLGGEGGTGSTPERPAFTLLRPDEVRILSVHEASIEGTDFIRRWQRYGEARTDAPPAFHQMAGIVLVATAVDRQRWLDLQHKTIYPAVYGLNLADSGQRKSTPIAYAVAATVSACPDRHLANDYSPEALIADLSSRSERPDSRGTAFIDEAGRLLNTMRKNQYGEGLKDLFNHLWDAPEHFSRKLMKGEYVLHSVYVNLLMATTRTRFTEATTPEDITSGFLARFLLILVKEEVTRRALSIRTPETDETERELIQALTTIRERLAKNPGPARISPEALARLDQAEEDLEGWAAREFHTDLICPWARRLAEYGTRLAIIFAVSEGQDEIRVEQVLRAIQVIDRAKDDVCALVEDLTMGQTAKDVERLHRLLRANPGLTAREIQRKTKWLAKKAAELVTELCLQGRLRTKDEGHSKRYYARAPEEETA